GAHGQLAVERVDGLAVGAEGEGDDGAAVRQPQRAEAGDGGGRQRIAEGVEAGVRFGGGGRVVLARGVVDQGQTDEGDGEQQGREARHGRRCRAVTGDGD